MAHTLTQKRFSQCSDRMQWFVHLMIMTGYATIFLLVVVLLNGLTVESLKFQRGWPEYPLFHPIRLLGYYATFAILYGTTYALIGRLKKNKPVYRNSHSTDWMFLILLQLTALTGIFINFTRLLNWPASDLRHLHHTPDGGRAHAAPGSSLRQVGSSGLPPAGHLFAGGQGTIPGRNSQDRGRGLREASVREELG